MYAEHAVAMLKKHNYRRVEPKTLFIVHSGVWHWTNPLQNSMQTFIDIYHKGMRVGDTETALVSIYYYLEATFYTGGRDLESIEGDLCAYMNQMVDYKQEKTLCFSKCFLQCIRNLQGKSANTTTLTGSVMDQEESLKKYEQEKDELMIGHINRRRMFLACYFGEHEVGAELAVREGDRTRKAIVAQTSVPVVTFVGALSCFVEARRTKKKRYRKQARKYRRMIKQWSHHNPNCFHYSLILDAEKAALGGNVKQAVELYEKAIVLTGRSGLIHDQALANERLAELHLEQNMQSDATYRFERAIELYSEWKAKPKARQLQKRVNDLQQCTG
jgi:tetratricopeptide (TPR) repeat protein